VPSDLFKDVFWSFPLDKKMLEIFPPMCPNDKSGQQNSQWSCSKRLVGGKLPSGGIYSVKQCSHLCIMYVCMYLCAKKRVVAIKMTNFTWPLNMLPARTTSVIKCGKIALLVLKPFSQSLKEWERWRPDNRWRCHSDKFPCCRVPMTPPPTTRLTCD
jgi:hypothetical protein